MSYNLTVHAAAGATATSGVDTTGSKLLVITVEGFNGIGVVTGTINGVSDGNTYTQLTDPGGATRACLFYCASPNVGANHVFSASGTFPSIYVQAFSGADLYGPFNKESGTTAATQPGSLTPDYANCLVVTAINVSAGAAPTVNSGFTISDTLVNDSTFFTGGMAYKIQTSAAAVNPTWSAAGQVVMAVFVPTGTRPHVTYTTPQAIVVRTPMTTSPTSDGGGTSPAYTLQSGTLPPGCTLNSGTGVISGTPTTKGTGTYTPTIRLTTSTGTFDFQITFTVTGWGPGLIVPVCAFEADRITGVSDGIAVVAGDVLDVSGNGKNVASIAGTGPKYKATGGPNSNPYLLFEGAGELVLPAVGAQFLSTFTVVVVMAKTGATAEAVIGSGVPGTDAWMLKMSNATLPQLVATGSGTDTALGTSSIALSGWGVVSAIQTLASTCYTPHLYVNAQSAGGCDGNNQTLHPTSQVLHIGGINSTLRLNGKIARIFVYDQVLNADEWNRIHAYITSKDALTLQAYTFSLIFDGDSITYGLSGFPTQFRQLLATHYAAQGCYQLSFGCPSNTLADLNSRYTSTIAPLFSSGVAKNIFIAFAGTNIEGTDTGSQAYTRATTLIAAAQLTGFRVIFPTMLNRSGEETYQTAYNSAIVSGALADSIPQWQNDAAITFADGIHPDVAGHTRMENPWLRAAVDSLVFSSGSGTSTSMAKSSLVKSSTAKSSMDKSSLG